MTLTRMRTIGSNAGKDKNMFDDWITANIGTIVISLILIAAVALAVRSIIVRKKSGRCSCGDSCGGCPMSGNCHKKTGH